MLGDFNDRHGPCQAPTKMSDTLHFNEGPLFLSSQDRMESQRSTINRDSISCIGDMDTV